MISGKVRECEREGERERERDGGRERWMLREMDWESAEPQSDQGGVLIHARMKPGLPLQGSTGTGSDFPGCSAASCGKICIFTSAICVFRHVCVCVHYSQ